MDELAESLGQLSTSAKEWKPGQGYATTKVTPTSPATPQPPDNSQSSWNPHAEFIPSAAANAVARAPQSQMWQPNEPTQDYTPTTATSAASSALSSSYSHYVPNTFRLTHHTTTRSLSSLGLPSHALWDAYRNRTQNCSSQLLPNDERYKAIPPQYTHADLLDGHVSSFGYPSSGVYKVTSRRDGKLYCVRRLDNVRSVNSTIAHAVYSLWERAVIPTTGMPLLYHAGLVHWDSVLVPNRQSVVFVHGYHANAWTLYECLWNRSSQRSRSGSQTQHLEFTPLGEGLIWSYATQLVGAIQAVHAANLGVRVLDLNRILVTPELGSGIIEDHQGASMGSRSSMVALTHRVRLRINCIGVLDALEFEARKPVSEVQAHDIESLGRILLSLASGMEIGPDTDWDVISRCESYIRSKYSPSLVELTLACLASRGGRGGRGVRNPPSMEWICVQVAQPALEELDSAHAVIDGMDAALAAEYESARGLRLLLKLGFVNERPEFGVDSRWSESGDCYVLKLFRDYGGYSTNTLPTACFVLCVFHFSFVV